jgi:hypothetical protein
MTRRAWEFVFVPFGGISEEAQISAGKRTRRSFLRYFDRASAITFCQQAALAILPEPLHAEVVNYSSPSIGADVTE